LDLLKNKNPWKIPGVSAEEEIRTPTPVTALPPQSSASTNFATSAFFEVAAKIVEWGESWKGLEKKL
jgi:hypothetical protein